MYLLQDFQGVSFLKTVWGLVWGTPTSAVLLFRLSSWCHRHRLKPFDTLFWSLNIALHGCDISSAATIGPGFNLVHTVGVVIGPISAGSNLTVFQNVTIGYGGVHKSDRGHATLGNRVILYAGCVVAGPIRIGDDVQVGANAAAITDIPSGSTAVGIPAKILPRQAGTITLSQGQDDRGTA